MSQEEFDGLKSGDLKFAVKTTIKRIKERSITKDNENLWNADEVYFLNYNKKEIVIRRGKEVFYIRAMEQNFSDPQVIWIVKDELGFK